MRGRMPMRDGLIAALPLVMSLAAMPSGVSGQESAAETLVTGRRSITFGVFSGGAGSFGVWKMRSQRTNLGLLVDGRIEYRHSALEGDDNDRTDTRVVIGVGPEVRRYASVSGRTAPYGFAAGRINASYQTREIEPDFDEDGWGAGVSARGGLGVDFFPVPNLSIGVQTGVGASLWYSPFETPLGDASTVSFNLSTFGASLGGAIYF